MVPVPASPHRPAPHPRPSKEHPPQEGLVDHTIFAFNRADIPADQQAATALIGSHLAFTTTDVSTRPGDTAAPTLTRMENTLNTPTPATEPAELRHALVDRSTSPVSTPPTR